MQDGSVGGQPLQAPLEPPQHWVPFNMSDNYVILKVFITFKIIRNIAKLAKEKSQ